MTTPKGAHGMGLACCPLCARRRSVFMHNGRRIFEHHLGRREHLLGDDVVCEGSGWLVEDDEVIR